MKHFLGVLALLVVLGLLACENGSAENSKPEDAGDGAGGAPNEGPPDTLFETDVVNEIEEGNYFLTGEDEGSISIPLILSFPRATHVELTFAGGEVGDVSGWPIGNEGSRFSFEFPSSGRPEYDFSAGTYRVDFLAQSVDGEFRLDLFATPLGGSEL